MYDRKTLEREIGQLLLIGAFFERYRAVLSRDYYQNDSIRYVDHKRKVTGCYFVGFRHNNGISLVLSGKGGLCV